ncbi:MAG: glutamine-hydrolyzing GMP synthase [Candidatus Peregrinibacteria bacterium]
MDKIAVLDYGGQYAHLIANRIRRFGVYTEILDGETPAGKLIDYKGLILSGGPASVIAKDSIKCDSGIFDLGIPILGICYGHQLIADVLDGVVEQGRVREYGPAHVNFSERKGVFEGVGDSEDVWMSHFDQVMGAPGGFSVVGSTSDCPVAAMANYERNIYGVQFHPEVTHTPCGRIILENFINITGAKREWNIDVYAQNIIEEIKEKAGEKKVFLLVSGGVDSTVAFLLIQKALGKDRVYGLFVDTGFMRFNERNEVESALKKVGVENLHVYDASEQYFEALKGIYEPEEKRKIIGDLFVDIQKKVSDELNLNPDEWLLAQGTIYPDTIETGGTAHAARIKTHHNRAEKIQKLIDEGKVIEPVSQLYKDEVRLLGERMSLSEEMVWRHPFPGPGLAVRILCAKGPDFPPDVEVLETKINEVVSEKGLKAKVLPIKSVGVQGDERTYRHPVLLYGEWNSWDDLSMLSTRLTNQFPEINRVLLGLKPDNFDELEVPDLYLTKDRVSTIQTADKIVMDYLVEAKIDRDIWQFPTVLVPMQVGSQTSESIVLRPVCSEEAMTANFYRMEISKLNELVKRLSGLNGISGIFYDITNKPPATIEWE